MVILDISVGLSKRWRPITSYTLTCMATDQVNRRQIHRSMHRHSRSKASPRDYMAASPYYASPSDAGYAVMPLQQQQQQQQHQVMVGTGILSRSGVRVVRDRCHVFLMFRLPVQSSLRLHWSYTGQWVYVSNSSRTSLSMFSINSSYNNIYSGRIFMLSPPDSVGERIMFTGCPSAAFVLRSLFLLSGQILLPRYDNLSHESRTAWATLAQRIGNIY